MRGTCDVLDAVEDVAFGPAAGCDIGEKVDLHRRGGTNIAGGVDVVATEERIGAEATADDVIAA